MVRRFRRKKTHVYFSFLYFSEFQVLPRHARKKFNGGRSDCVGLNIKLYLTSKVDPMLRLSNYKATLRKITHVRTKLQMSTPFSGDRSWFVCTRVLWVPAKPLTFFGGGVARNFTCPRTQISQKQTEKNTLRIWREKKKIEEKKRRTVTGWQGFIEHVCQISGSYLHKKRRGHWNGNGLAGVHIIEHVCEISGSFISTKRRGHCMRIRFWVDVAWTSLYTEWSSCRRPPPKNGFWDISESLIPRSTIPWHRCITNTTVKHYYGRT